MNRGRPPSRNLFRIGFEAAAEFIADRIDKRGTCHVWVLADGGIIVRDLYEGRCRNPPDDALIGTYRQGWKTVEMIEDDLIEHLRQCNKDIAA